MRDNKRADPSCCYRGWVGVFSKQQLCTRFELFSMCFCTTLSTYPRSAQLRLGEHPRSLSGAALSRQRRRGHGLEPAAAACPTADISSFLEKPPMRVVLWVIVPSYIAGRNRAKRVAGREESEVDARHDSNNCCLIITRIADNTTAFRRAQLKMMHSLTDAKPFRLRFPRHHQSPSAVEAPASSAQHSNGL